MHLFDNIRQIYDATNFPCSKKFKFNQMVDYSFFIIGQLFSEQNFQERQKLFSSNHPSMQILMNESPLPRKKKIRVTQIHYRM